MRIALVNCCELPEPDFDEAPLLRALRARGVDAQTLAWDDPEGEPAAFDACVLRATWNAHLHPGPFLAWCRRAAACSQLVNPLPLIEWNLDKVYLRELEGAGVPTVPTAFVARGSDTNLHAVLDARGWRDVVIKPRIGAGSYLTRRFEDGRSAEADAFLASLTTQGDAMVQAYMASVESVGERSIVWIAGEITHVIRKRPRFDADEESVEGPFEATEAERALATRALDAAPGGANYARIDVMTDEAGLAVVSELELIEPSLFLPQCPAACDRLARALEQLAAGVLPDRQA